jgi:hypothetical protein
MHSPELEALLSALEQFHARILYEEVGIEFIGYDEELFKKSEGRTLAARLCWILKNGGTLRGVQYRNGEKVGPSLRLDQLKERWIRLGPIDQNDKSDEVVVRVVRGFLGFTD